MTLEQFCKKAGCVVSLREDWEGYEGKWMYYNAECPRVRFCGYKTKQAAYKGFLEGAYGKTAAKAIVMLLKKVTE